MKLIILNKWVSRKMVTSPDCKSEATGAAGSSPALPTIKSPISSVGQSN